MTKNDTPIDIIYPATLIEHSKNFPTDQAVPCSIVANNTVIPGLFINCSKKDLRYFNIGGSNPPQPILKFRMMNFEQKVYTIEIWMLFDPNLEKALKLHLNPYKSEIKELLQLGLQTGMISFHFRDSKSKEIFSAVKKLEEHEYPWFERNAPLAQKLPEDVANLQSSLSSKLQDMMDPTDRFYDQYNPYDHHKELVPDFFVRKGSLMAKLSEI